VNCLVTGAAGFIGSFLCERLLSLGHKVDGIDAFIPYYPRSLKETNLKAARSHDAFRFHEVDLRIDSLEPFVQSVDAIFHLAAMAGLAKSWTEFDLYASCNLTGTERLLEAIRQSGVKLKRFVYASTSSVYGRYASGDESLPTRPISPYGVTKLAAENLCRAYMEVRDLPLVVLRYFSVYGPRQRPDMGYHLFIDAMLRDQPVTVFGDGMQMRGNTYIDDCTAATVAAVDAAVGETFNVGGGEIASVWDILGKLEHIIGRPARAQRAAARPGDQRHTGADAGKLARHLGWQPRVGLDAGLQRQVAWQQAMIAG
jgi:nucleoside-diphosphate-sugar epimerase